MTIKLNLPPGMFKNNTEYSGAGRFTDGSLVRWQKGKARAMGGWVPRFDTVANSTMAPIFADPNTEAVRSGIAIGDVAGSLNVYLGSNKKIYQVANSNTVTDVTPVGFIAQAVDALSSSGYGLFVYGLISYGSERPVGQADIPKTFTWGFSPWGGTPIAVARNYGGASGNVFVQTTVSNPFTLIANAPTGVADAVVTDERFLMTAASNSDDRIIRWSDQENYNQWTPDATNQSGFNELVGYGRLVRLCRVANQVLILSETDAHTAQYVGPPFVYGFSRVGHKCGIVGPEAVAFTKDIAMWLSSDGFWIFDGEVKKVQCEIWDFLKSNIDRGQISKTYGFTMTAFDEVWFLYQSVNSVDDCDRYAVYNYAENVWYCGALKRTFGLDSQPLRRVLMVDRNGQLYNHEGENAPRTGADAWVETGPLELESGDRLMAMSHIYPDETFEGSVRLQIRGRDMPNLPDRIIREFEMSSPVSTTGVMARELRMKFTSTDPASKWVLGDFRVDIPRNLPRR